MTHHARFLDCLVSQLQQSPFPAEVNEQFFTEQALAGENKLFLGLTTAFSPAFPSLSDEQEVILNAATYLGARGIYQLDGVLDQQVQGQQRIDQAYHGQLFMLESQRLLGQLFSLSDAFWPVYYRRVEQHYRELTISKAVHEPLTEAAYWHLLDCKYAMLYCPIDALFHLTGQANAAAYETLLQSLRWFTKGYNLPNEVMGVAEDRATAVNNYAYWRLRQVLLNADIDVPESPDDLQRFLYASGLATALMDEAIEALHRADDLAAPLNLPAYHALILRRMDNVNQRKAVIADALLAV